MRALFFFLVILLSFTHLTAEEHARSQGAVLCSTFFGGTDSDGGFCLAQDGNDSVYLGGYTQSGDLPTTPNAYQKDHGGGGYDFYIAKFDASLTTLQACTYLGGSDTEGPWGFNLALDSAGNVIVAGPTPSTDLATTPGAYSPNYMGGVSDVYIAKLDSNLENLLAATYLGGTKKDGGEGLSFALDGDGNVYVAGITKSGNFPTTPGAYDPTYGIYWEDGFITKLDNNLTTLLGSTYLGGSNKEFLSAITLDAQGNIYVAGVTYSGNFPTTPGAYSETKGLSNDGFISRLNSDLTALSASTFLGGDSGEGCHLMVLDEEGMVFVSGQTDADSMPITPGAFDPSHNGNWDNYIAKLDSDLENLLGCTYLGGSGMEFGHAMACDASGNIYLSGGTASGDHPTTPGAYSNLHSGGGHDLFLSKLTPDLTQLSASTFIGASNEEVCYKMMLNIYGELYLTGPTGSNDLHVTPDAYNPVYNGGDNDAYVMRFVLTGMHADARTLSEQGGTVNFAINAGTENAGRQYLVLGTLSGTQPGIPLPGNHVLLPLNWDLFTDLIWAWINSPVFSGFLGTLDTEGNSIAQIISGPMVPGFVGVKMHYAACLNHPFNFVTNPVEIEIVP